MDAFQTGTRLFALTDNNKVFALEVVDNVEIPSGDSSQVLRRLNTRIADATQTVEQTPIHEWTDIEAAYESYFRRLYLRDGVLDTAAVHTTEAAAIRQALVNVQERKSRAQSMLDAATAQESALKKALLVLGAVQNDD